MKALALAVSILTSAVGLADEAAVVEERAPDRSIGAHVAVNVGLFALDAQLGHFYAFGAGNLGVPLLTDGRAGFGMIGAGYTFALGPITESHWQVDMMGLATAGRIDSYQTLGGVGVGVGFRYLHTSGFTFGAKIPVFGATLPLGGSSPFGGPYTGAASLGNFYLASFITLPCVSFGYRW
jgi:hypothetical protein